MTDPDALDVAGVADELGFHPDTVRKNWRAWADPGHRDYLVFPAPFRYPPPGRKGRCWWRASAIAEWKLARERALGPGRAEPATYRHDRVADQVARRADPALARRRAEIIRLQERA